MMKKYYIGLRPELNEVYQGPISFQPKEVFGLVEKHRMTPMIWRQEVRRKANKQQTRDVKTFSQLLGQNSVTSGLETWALQAWFPMGNIFSLLSFGIG